jgi:hypothetical protein
MTDTNPFVSEELAAKVMNASVLDSVRILLAREDEDADTLRSSWGTGIFIMLLESEVDFTEFQEAVGRYLKLPPSSWTHQTAMESLIEELWAPALAWAANLPEDYRAHDHLARLRDRAPEDYLGRLLASLRDCWKVLARAQSNSAAEVRILVDIARAKQNDEEELWLDADEDGAQWRALALIAIYHHLAAVEAIATGDYELAQEQLGYADRAADCVDTYLSVATSMMAGAVAVRTDVAAVKNR